MNIVKRILMLSVLLLCLAGVLVGVQAQDYPDENPPYKVEQINDRFMVTSIIWDSNGRMFWTEKDGVVGTMSPDGVIQEEPVIQVTVWNPNEDGLLSIVLDSAFDESHYFYVFYTAPVSLDNPEISNLIVRYSYVEENGISRGIDPLLMMRIVIPTVDMNLHNGGRMKFGEDGSLYVTIGDMGDRTQAQDFTKIGGKIHRFVVVGDHFVPAPNNPLIGNSVWAFGVRNTFAFDFDPMGGLFATENGPDCEDEINRILPGQNYGWTSDINCDDPLPIRQSVGMLPFVTWTPTIAPTGILYYTGEAFPTWQNQVFYCSWKVQQLRRYHLTPDHSAFDGDSIEVDVPNDAHCMIELAQGPDGYIYYSSVNGIYRIVPR